MRLLLGWYAESKVSAKDFAIACHLCSTAGVVGADFERWATEPGQPSEGMYQRRLDKVLPARAPLCWVATPYLANGSKQRNVVAIPTVLLHECIAREIKSNPDIIASTDPDRLPPSYRRHPLVQQALHRGEAMPVPIALYLDGVRYTAPLAGRSESVVGIWAHTLATNKRHLLVAVRTRRFCTCGCKGWCTLQPLLWSLAWCMRVLASGVRPRACAEKPEMSPGLAEYHDKFGPGLGFTGIVLWLKGDWAEASHTLALPSVCAAHRPCPFCTQSSSTLHSSYRTFAFPAPEHSYEELCRNRETSVLIDTED